MPFYIFSCPDCKNEFDVHCSMSSIKEIGELDENVLCEKCKKACKRVFATGISGGSIGEIWEYEYTHQMRPKFIKDSKGNRMPFNPNTMPKGRRGQG